MHATRPRLFLCVLMLASLCGIASSALRVAAANLCVNQSGAGGCYTSIAAAIQAAASGDTIVIAAGGYFEPQVGIAKSLTIIGAGRMATTWTANDPNARPLTISSGVVTVTGMTLIGGNVTSDNGGAISNTGNLTLTDVLVTGGSTHYDGAGIYNNGTLTLINSEVSGNNAASGNGGGIMNNGGSVTLRNSVVARNRAINGGGIDNFVGSLMMDGSTLFGNAAENGCGIFAGGTMITLTNTTLSGNIARPSSGGAAYLGSVSGINSVASFTYVTLAGDTSGIRTDTMPVTLTGTLLADNGANCAVGTPGLITSGGHNLDTGATCGLTSGGTNVTNATPILGPLQQNGGVTPTYALMPGSPGIDQGGIGCPAVDQRGANRPAGSQCDIGAFEYVPLVFMGPGSGPATGGTVVTIGGFGLTPATTVTFDGLPASVSATTAGTTVTATSPAHGAAPVAVTVSVPGSQSATFPNAFTFVAAPSIAAINPPIGALASFNHVTITGTGFQIGAVVTIGPLSIQMLVTTGTSIDCTVASDTPGTFDVIVTNPDKQSAILSHAYTVNERPAPPPVAAPAARPAQTVIGSPKPLPPPRP